MSTFPYLPMVAIMMTLVTDMVVQMNVVAYSGFMVEHLGVVDDKDKAGYYAGLISTSFMLGRLFTSHFWGLVSDRYGCRFVMAFGLCSTVVLSLAFGCSPTFAWAVAFRFLLGLANGTMVAGKTIVSDVCGKEHDTVGMGVVTAAFSLGQVIGPGVGGMLSEPATQYPGTFSETGIFGRYPYLLPNVVLAGMAISALPLVFLFLEDSKHAKSENPTSCACTWSWLKCGCGGDDGDGVGKVDRASATKAASALPIEVDAGDRRVPSWMETDIVPAPAIQSRSGYDAESLENDLRDKHKSGYDADSLEHGSRDPKPKSLLWQHHIRVLLVIDALYSLTYSGLEAVFTLWVLSSIAKGGLNWSAMDIGQVFFACGVMLLAFELFAVPIFTPRLGVRFCQRLGSVIEVPIYIAIPLLSLLSNTGLAVQIVAAVLLFTFLACSDPFYIGICLAINNSTGPGRRRELNGISMTTSSVARSISPVLSSALFAFSIDGDHPFPFDYHFAFFFLAGVRLTVACMGWNRICDNGAVGGKRMIFGE